MSGLRRILKSFGEAKIGDQKWLWDYAADEPVKAEDMPFGSERHKASERARYAPSRPSPPNE